MKYIARLPDFLPFYAGKFEPRIGGWRESADQKLRLDIGTSIELWRNTPTYSEDEGTPLLWLVGTEFFTWTRLRSAGGFKFPVEAVDYHFGLIGQLAFSDPLALQMRVAHVSAHLVDGDTTFFASGGKPVTFSREFIDTRLFGRRTLSSRPFRDRAEVRYYAGGNFLFHTIPDTLGRFSPYAGGDFQWQVWEDKPVTVRLGYEARLNTELEPIGEHSVRAGVKFAHISDNGVMLEGAYYTGRSPYGQYFSRRENYFSLGFSVEH